jgi:hypothetical protein
MGFASSKIPSTYPGQALKLVGIEEIDSYLVTFEPIVKQIDHIRTEVDLRFSDLIDSLGANKFWERGIGFNEIMKMLIIVLSINHEKGIESVKFKETSPFLIYDMAVSSSAEKLKSIQDNFNSDQVLENCESFNEEIMEKIVSLEYSTDEMIRACEILDEDCNLIKKALNSMKKIIKLNEVIRVDIRFVYDESFSTAKFPKIIQQCALAKHQGLHTPETIVRFFWPYPNI